MLRAFEATAALSGRKRQVNPGDVVECDADQPGPTITIEVDLALLLVDLSTFRTCCEIKTYKGGLSKDPPAGFLWLFRS